MSGWGESGEFGSGWATSKQSAEPQSRPGGQTCFWTRVGRGFGTAHDDDYYNDGIVTQICRALRFRAHGLYIKILSTTRDGTHDARQHSKRKYDVITALYTLHIHAKQCMTHTTGTWLHFVLSRVARCMLLPVWMRPWRGRQAKDFLWTDDKRQNLYFAGAPAADTRL